MKKSSLFITLLLVFLLSFSTVSAQEGDQAAEATSEATVEATEPATEPTAESTEEAAPAEPTAEPTEAATPEPPAPPTDVATPPEPTAEPTEAAPETPIEPAAEPTEETSEEPTAEPTVQPTVEAAAAVEAAAIPSLTSGFQLQNLSTSATANIVINFYTQAGALTTQSDTIAASSSKTYFPLSAVPSGFNGSVVVQSDQSLAGIVNLLGAGTLSGGASYDSLSTGATTVNIPLVIKGVAGINSFVNVQNTTGSTANVTVTYPGTGCPPQVLAVPGNSSQTFDQAADTCLPAGFVGSAQATSSAAIVAAVVEYDPNSLLAYDGFTSGANSTNPVMPLVIGNLVNTDTGIQIQNVGGSATDITVTYTPAAGQPGATCTETQTINAGQSANFGVGNVFPSTNACIPGTGGSPNPAKGSFVGGAAVTTNTASQPLVVIVNQAVIGGAQSSASAGFNPASATNKVSIPLIIKDLPVPGGLLFTGYNLANVGGGTASVTCTFTGSAVTEVFSIPVGGVVNSVQFGGGSALPAAYIGSATCTGAASDKIVAVVNQVGGLGDSLLTYEGFNQ